VPVIRGSLAGIVACVVLLGYTPRTQPAFYSLLVIFVVVYVVARGEELFGALLDYLASRTLRWKWMFILWAIASLFWSTRGVGTEDRAITLIEIQVLGLVFFDAAKHLGQARWILTAVLASCAVGVGQALTTGIGAAGLRLEGMHGNPNILGIVLLTGLAVFYASADGGSGWLRRALWHTVSLGLLFGVALTSSRKAIMGAALLWAVAIIRRGTRKRLVAHAASAVAVGSVLIFAVPLVRAYWQMIVVRVSSMFFNVGSMASVDLSFAQRVRLVGEGVRFMAESPIVGRGLDTFYWLSAEDAYAHNNMVELGVSLGLIGLVMFYGFYAALFFGAAKRVNRDQPVGRFLLLLIPMMVFLDLGHVSYYMKLPALLMITGAGWLERPAANVRPGQ
jgi:O-antigen ligase